MNGINVTNDGPVAIVTISRPAQRNSMTLAMWREMAAIFTRLGGDRGIRAIVLAGAGQDFSTGADIGEFAKVRADAAQSAAYEAAVDACSDAIRSVPKPAIAALSGYCLGGGCHLAMACDFRFVDETAKIGIPAARLSIVYGVRSTQRLLALVGLSAAKHILFSGKQFGPQEGRQIGFVDRIVPDALAEARQYAAELARNAPLSIAGAKQILDGLATGAGTLDQAAARRLIDEAAASEDYAEGRLAFAQKRAPEFKGR